jgi:ankyrin repeat protein
MPETALNRAILISDEAAWELLYAEPPADPNLVGNKGKNALHLAVIICDDRALIELIIEKIHDINAVDEDGNTALIIAAMHGYLFSVQDIMKKGGVNKDITNNADLNALDYANLIEDQHNRNQVIYALVPRSGEGLMGLKNTLRF